MTALRKSMIACLPRRGLSARTQERDVRAVRQLAEHSHTSPDVLTEEARRPYCLSLKHVQHSARSASTMALGGITCFCASTLHRAWTTRSFVRAPREQKLPVVLRIAEVRTLLGRVRRRSSRVCLSTLSSWGLRLQEGTQLHGRESDSARERDTAAARIDGSR